MIANVVSNVMFTNFLALVNSIEKNNCLCWITNLNTGIDQLALEFAK